MALSQGTGQGNKLAFHLIQSFAPGEVDADTAHEIGIKLADKVLKGNYSYVLATHKNTHSVHNHIVFCAVDNFEHKKYYDSKKTYRQIRSASDSLCKEYGLSIIDELTGNKGLSYKEWISRNEGRLWKATLKDDIRKCIKDSNTYDDFILLTKDLGYEVKGEALLPPPDSCGNADKITKYISFRAPGQAHFIRGSVRGLGKGYSKEEIAEAIEKQAKVRAMEAPMPVKKIEDLVKNTAPYDRLIDRSGDKFKESPGLNRWADKRDLQSAAHAFAQAGDTVQLQNKIDKTRAKAAKAKAAIMVTEGKIEAYKELSVYAKNYRQYKKVSDAYERSGDKEKFFETHESQLMIYDAAERQIRAMGLNPAKVTYEKVMGEIKRLSEQKKEAQAEYRDVSKELRDMEKQMGMMREYIARNEPVNPKSRGARKQSGKFIGFSCLTDVL